MLPFALALMLTLACREARAVNWFPFGPDGGDARAFAADPKNHLHVYLGTANGWVYQTQDGGKHWERLASIAKRDDLVIDNILIDPTDPQHIVIGAWKLADLHHSDGGIYVSHDAGKTWVAQADMRGRSVLALAVAPSDPKTLVAGSMDGVFRSTDSGVHWELISPRESKELHEVESVAVDPQDPKIIYAGTWHLPWKTTDGGVSWQNFKNGIAEDSDVFSIIVDPKQPNSIYLSACSGIYMSNDAGGSFSRAQGIPHTAIRTRVLMQDPNHASTVFAGTTGGLYRTQDGGHLWTPTTGSDVIVNDVFVDPTDSKHVLLATDRGGVLASEDGGTSFRQSSGGFSTRQVVAYVGDAQHPATVYVGVVNDKEWGGVFVSHNGGLNWAQMSGGLDGRDVFSLGQTADGSILAGTGHGIYRWSGAIWERVAAEVVLGPMPASGGPRAVMAAKPVVAAKAVGAKGRVVAAKPARPLAPKGKAFDGVVYGFTRVGDGMLAATSQGLLTGTASGKSWTSAPSATTDEYHYVAAANSTVAVASLSALELSSDGGGTWRTLPLPQEVTQVTALAVDARGGVWLGGREGLFYASEAGGSWKLMKDVYLRNPDCIFFDEAKNRMLVTSNGPATTIFAVQLPTMEVTWWDTGWNLRFARPIGDHLLAATLFDGMVVQPRMVAVPPPTTAAR